jgi:hypothetical protein
VLWVRELTEVLEVRRVRGMAEREKSEDYVFINLAEPMRMCDGRPPCEEDGCARCTNEGDGSGMLEVVLYTDRHGAIALAQTLLAWASERDDGDGDDYDDECRIGVRQVSVTAKPGAAWDQWCGVECELRAGHEGPHERAPRGERELTGKK